MIYVFLLFIIICLIRIQFNKDGFKDYLGKKQTTAMKGIFSIIIFFSHFNTYVTLNNIKTNNIYIHIISAFGQLMVAIFLFYSGYGVYWSAQNKEEYIKKFPKNRILKTLINFDLAVLLFLIVDICLGIKYNIKDVLLSFVGWSSIRQ